MQLTTISQLSREYDISPRTLRYYEQLGLIESIRTDSYAYRSYDEMNCAKLRQIVLLRKLRIPIKEIEELLQNDDTRQAIAVFERHIREIDGDINALETLRSILAALVQRLNAIRTVKLRDHMLNDASMHRLIHTMTDEPPKLKEMHTMNDLNRANAELGKLKDVRIMYLPPATVAASHYIGDEPEGVAWGRLFDFARESKIAGSKPDLRVYGFNHPNPVDETNAHGYEFWLTIPDDMDVPQPLEKKRFEGGLYAAHMIKMGDFHEWQWLDDWVKNSREYEYRGNGSGEDMFGCLEEHLNIYSHLQSGGKEFTDIQLDLLIPVRKKEK